MAPRGSSGRLEEEVDVGAPLGRVLFPVAVDLPAGARPLAAVRGAPLLQGRVGAGQVGVLPVVGDRGALARGRVNGPDRAARREAAGYLDAGVDGDLTAHGRRVVDDDVVPVTGA